MVRKIKYVPFMVAFLIGALAHSSQQQSDLRLTLAFSIPNDSFDSTKIDSEHSSLTRKREYKPVDSGVFEGTPDLVGIFELRSQCQFLNEATMLHGEAINKTTTNTILLATDYIPLLNGKRNREGHTHYEQTDLAIKRDVLNVAFEQHNESIANIVKNQGGQCDRTPSLWVRFFEIDSFGYQPEAPVLSEADEFLFELELTGNFSLEGNMEPFNAQFYDHEGAFRSKISSRTSEKLVGHGSYTQDLFSVPLSDKRLTFTRPVTFYEKSVSSKKTSYPSYIKVKLSGIWQ